MNKHKKLCLFTLFCYVLFAILAIALIVVCAVGIGSVPEDNDDLGVGLGAAILLIVLIFTAIYAALSLIPIALKLLQLRHARRGFPIACMLFDLAYLFVHTALLVNVCQNSELGAAVLFAALSLLSAATLVTNFLSIKALKEGYTYDH